jgi:ankyrin repeat protein
MNDTDSILDDFADAIERNDSTFVESLLFNRDVDANARLPCQTNPPALVHAAWRGRAGIVEALLNAGARIDSVDDGGYSACHAAAMLGNINIMRLLLAHRPNLALRTTDGDTALQKACGNFYRFRDDDDIAILLIQAGASVMDVDHDQLIRLAASSITAIQVLMNQGVDLRNLRGKNGHTPLHLAARKRGASGIAVLRKLVECGVDCEAVVVDSTRSTCSSVAIMRDNADALRLFLQVGANVNGGLDSAYDEPLLQKAVSWNRFECTMLLLAAGADVAARDRHGRTALLEAVQSNLLMSIVHAILAAGADLDAADGVGQTPRLCLAECGRT